MHQNPVKVTEEVEGYLKALVTHVTNEDLAVRERQLLTWRRLKFFWEGLSNVWYDSVAHDWRIYDMQANENNNDQAYYDKKVNVFRAYLESIIAALSVTIPPVKCYPDDADNASDLVTAKAGDKAAELVYKHNDAAMLWLHALYIYCTEGLVIGRHYSKSDKEYGQYKVEEYEDVAEERAITSCPSCGYEIDSQVVDPNALPVVPPTEDLLNNETLELQGMEDVPLEQEEVIPGMGQDACPSCGELITPQMEQKTVSFKKLLKEAYHNKNRVCIETYGGLNVKVPNYARNQKECLYLIYSYETHYAQAIEIFNHLSDKLLDKKIRNAEGSAFDTYEQWARLSPQYRGEYPENQVTPRYIYLRPAMYNILDLEQVKELKKEFPEGVCVAMVNDNFAECYRETLDDNWTLMYNPQADFVHFDPLGMLLTSIQEITNDIMSLVVQTMEHGIGQTFADPDVLNFTAYSQTEATPGGIYPAKPKSGKALGDAFFEIKTATLNGEVLPFAQNVQQLGQLVSGALPSLFGGQLEGSETASEYSMSRSQATQRLQNTWKMFCTWWKVVYGKAIPMYLEGIKEDEKNVKRLKDGSFINSFIRKTELEGKIGQISLEANENLPLTWSQRKDIVMQLLQSPNPQLIQMMMAPENLDVVRDAIGLNDFYVIGEDDRTKQYEEISLLLNSEPIEMPPPPEALLAAEEGMPMEPMKEPSVMIDEIMDSHIIHFEICRKWAISESGRLAKNDNPEGYENVLLHAKQHLAALAVGEPMAPQDGPGAPNPEKPNENSNKNAPITGDKDVQTVQ